MSLIQLIIKSGISHYIFEMRLMYYHFHTFVSRELYLKNRKTVNPNEFLKPDLNIYPEAILLYYNNRAEN